MHTRRGQTHTLAGGRAEAASRLRTRLLPCCCRSLPSHVYLLEAVAQSFRFSPHFTGPVNQRSMARLDFFLKSMPYLDPDPP